MYATFYLWEYCLKFFSSCFFFLLTFPLPFSFPLSFLFLFSSPLPSSLSPPPLCLLLPQPLLLPFALLSTWDLFPSYPGCPLVSKVYMKVMEVLCVCAGSWGEGSGVVMADLKMAIYGIPFPTGLLSYLQEDLSMFGLALRGEWERSLTVCVQRLTPSAEGDLLQNLLYVSPLPSAMWTSLQSWHFNVSLVPCLVAWLVWFGQDVGWAAGVWLFLIQTFC